MNTIVFLTHYLLPVAIGLMVLWVAYRLLFTNSNRFQFNRFYLLTAMLFSLALPLVGMMMGQSSPQVMALKKTLFNGFMLDEITISYGEPSTASLPEIVIGQPERMHISLWQVLGFIYLAGVVVTALLFLFKMGKLVVMIIRSPKRKMDGYTMVFTHKEHGPYSFFRYAFFTDENVNPDIIRHELSHISHHHSWDILMVELMKIFQWFNPFIYFYKRELQSLHEYIADDDVVATGADKRNYMMLILQQCTAVDFSDMSNNFSLILTKKRIKMITKHEKAKGFWWKLLATLPVLALLLIVNARASAQQMKKTDQTVYELNTSEITDVKINKMDNDTVYNIVEVMPEFPGGMDKMANYLSDNIKYPEEAKDKGISGRVFLSFVIEKDGSVNEVKVMKSVDPLLDNEAVRVVKGMPKWKPGTMKGKPVRVYYVLPISFKLDESATTAKKTNEKIYDTPETMPEYVGGMDAMIKYLQENITVPEKYQNMEAKAQYRVLVKFVVEADGSVTEVETVKPEPAKADLNEEAVRVVKGMPKWKPGTMDGKPVRVRYTLPITYKLGK